MCFGAKARPTSLGEAARPGDSIPSPRIHHLCLLCGIDELLDTGIFWFRENSPECEPFDPSAKPSGPPMHQHINAQLGCVSLHVVRRWAKGTSGARPPVLDFSTVQTDIWCESS